MGNKLKSEEIVLLLFTLFGILVILFLFLIAIVFQTWALWKMAKVVVEQNTPEDGGRRRSAVSSAFIRDGGLAGGTLVGNEDGGGLKERFH